MERAITTGGDAFMNTSQVDLAAAQRFCFGRSQDARRRWSTGSMKKTIHGTKSAVTASVRSARGQSAMIGPKSHKTKVSDG
jgi:hypothetical protein